MSGLHPIPIIDKLPRYNFPVSEFITTLEDGRVMATMSVQGMPFESESAATLEAAFTSFKGLLIQLSKMHGGDLAVWSHVVKKRDYLDTTYKFENEFMQSFSDKYVKSFSGQKFFSTRYYLTFVLKHKDTIDQGIDDLTEILNVTKAVMQRYDCIILGVSPDGSRCKNVEFLSFLLNNKPRQIPITENKIADVIGHSDWHFGYDMLEIRNADTNDSRYATFYEMDGYPQYTEAGMWDFILSQQCEFILTQSMILMKPYAAVKLLKEKANLAESGENIDHEIKELEEGKQQAATGEISFGDYHCSLAVFGDTQEQVLDDGADLSGEFITRGTMLKRSNLKSQFSFLSALPASKDRVMPSPKTTANLACTLSFHNYSQGKKKGNPIGDGNALIPLKTKSDTLFYFNCHASELGKNVTGEQYAGHTMLLGASGAGKTTLEGVLTGYLTRFNPQIFAIDYNRSTELYIRAYGGEYYPMHEGEDTGLNPFQLEHTPELVSFLNRLCCRLGANHAGHLTEEEEEEIKNGIDTVMRLPHENRGLSTLLTTIQMPKLRTRLKKWCRSYNGQYGWCLDSEQNKFNPANMDRVGFDTTLLLGSGSGDDAHPACEPILATLFFLKNLMQKEGRLLVSIVEEFWMPANFPLTSDQMKIILKAGRLKGEFMILSSQSPEDAINCKIFPAIVQQTATKIFLPNPDAGYESYKKCNVTKGEFDKLKLLEKTSRTFLVKQSNTSCFAKLDLHGFDEHLPIISGTDKDISASERIRGEVGDDPKDWIPALLKDIKQRKEKENEKAITN